MGYIDQIIVYVYDNCIYITLYYMVYGICINKCIPIYINIKYKYVNYIIKFKKYNDYIQFILYLNVNNNI